MCDCNRCASLSIRPRCPSQAALLVRIRRRGRLLPPPTTPPPWLLVPEATAIVTGAASGLGRAVAARLAAAGVRVVVAGWSLERCEEAANSIRAAVPGSRVVPMELDLSTADGVGQFLEAVQARGLARRIASCALGGGRASLCLLPRLAGALTARWLRRTACRLPLRRSGRGGRTGD